MKNKKEQLGVAEGGVKMEFNEAIKEVERIAREVGKTAKNEHFIYSRALNEFGSIARKQMNDDRADQLMERLYRH